jgi:hypothetical protein
VATEWEALGSAIYSRLSSAGTIPVYQDVAVQGGTPPYIVFQRLPSFNEYVFGTKRFINSRYIVKAVSNRRSGNEAQRIYGPYKTAMQDAPLSVTGYGELRCRADISLHYQDNDNFWHSGDEYLIDVHSE